MHRPRELFRKYRRRFIEVYNLREKLHHELLEEKVNQRGHGFFDHDLPVMQTCLLVHTDEHEMLKAWFAAMLHSLDRFLTKEKEDEMIEHFICQVPAGEFSANDFDDIRMAIKYHDGPNHEDDCLTKKILQDSDRAANAMSILIPRAGQFLPTIPVIEFGYLGLLTHPESTYRNPRSVHDNLMGVLAWDPEGPEADPNFVLRLPQSIHLARPHFTYLRGWIEKNRADMGALGLDPWPID